MRWFRRPTRFPSELEQSWRTSMPAGVPARILAAAPTADGWLVCSVALLSALDRTGEWSHTRWSEIEHGGWNPELSRLQWTRIDGRRGSALLADPGRVPMVFRDRVKASFVFTRTVPVTETAGIVISARRDLADPSAPLAWHATLQRGLSWQQPGVREIAEESVARYRAEFDPT